MIIKAIFLKNRALFTLLLVFLLQSCGGSKKSSDNSRGELIGAAKRKSWKMTIPFGMVNIPPGTFHMGQGDEDVPYTQINFNKQITIGGFYMDETEITNNEYRQFVEDIKRQEEENTSTETAEETETNVVEEFALEDILPDTMVWVRDFSYHWGDPIMRYYWFHPAYDDYPVVGVSWEKSQYFCKWRTKHLNKYRESLDQPVLPNFRLPSEAEWEYAARGGRDMAKYPWGNPYIRNTRGCMLANFKPGRGNYYDDGYAYTCPVGAFFANDFGLYEMSGNVAEWCQDAYNPSSVPLVWDLNPVYYNDNEKRKIVRGGSWKDIAYYCETGTRSFDYKDSARSSIGFRCAMTHLGRSSGSEF
ncbi:MAG: SUMF1/EgtB/PvdO family nonheme iron enzyme [Chitinophagaceae bacterium]|nr:SUMF1/EgtB/PvdO family nonheme iron enzyme [Chitinophagaceae bacterium]